jgi:cytochrome c oxidase assembly protein subunit 11
MTDVNQNGQAKRVSNSAIFAGCAVFVAGMVGAAYASVLPAVLPGHRL